MKIYRCSCGSSALVYANGKASHFFGGEGEPVELVICQDCGDPTNGHITDDAGDYLSWSDQEAVSVNPNEEVA